MKRKKILVRWLFCIFSLVFLVAVGVSAGAEQQLGNKAERLQWLQDAGFGLFVHFGVDSQLGSVISHSMVGASDDYLDRFINELPKTFNPKRFDAEELAILAKLAGMKYIVFGTKHHSGFCMWDTKTTDFSIMNTPYGRDIVAEYVNATRKHGLAVGVYYSPEDFLYLHRRNIMIRRRGASIDANKDAEYVRFIKSQCRALMTKYGPIDVMFIDGTGGEPAKEVFWTLQPDILITRGVLETPEQTLPGIPLEQPWEAIMTMGTQWQYKPTNENYKPGTRLIEILIETRAKGGALLLNVGPKPDGALPEEQEELLREIALWHFVNGEAIHDVRPWVVTNEGNIWFTKKKDADTLYGFITKIPDWERGTRKDFVLKSVEATKETKLDVLGQSSKWIEYRQYVLGWDPNSRWEQKEDGLHISVVRAQRLYNNSKWPNPVVLRLTDVKPALTPPRFETLEASDISAEGTATLRAGLKDLGDAELVEVGFGYRPYAGFVEELYDDTWLESEFITLKDVGEYEIKLKGLKKQQEYQFRAAVKHPRITMYGNIKEFKVP